MNSKVELICQLLSSSCKAFRKSGFSLRFYQLECSALPECNSPGLKPSGRL